MGTTGRYRPLGWVGFKGFSFSLCIRVFQSHITQGMSLYIEGICFDDLPTIVQLPQQWSAVNGSLRIQSTKPVVSAGLLQKEIPKDVLASKCKQLKKSESSFFQCPYVGLQQKMWPRRVPPHLDLGLALSQVDSEISQVSPPILDCSSFQI